MERLNAAIEAGEKTGLPDNDLVLKSARQMRDEEEHRNVAKQTLDALLALDPLGQENFVQQLTDAIHASEEAGLPAEDLREAKGKRVEALEVKMGGRNFKLEEDCKWGENFKLGEDLKSGGTSN